MNQSKVSISGIGSYWTNSFGILNNNKLTEMNETSSNHNIGIFSLTELKLGYYNLLWIIYCILFNHKFTYIL